MSSSDEEEGYRPLVIIENNIISLTYLFSAYGLDGLLLGDPSCGHCFFSYPHNNELTVPFLMIQAL